MSPKNDIVAEHLAVEMVQEAIAGMIQNRVNPEIRQALMALRRKIYSAPQAIESNFQIEDISFDAMVNKMVEEWIQRNQKTKNAKMRRATEQEAAYIENIKIAHEELDVAQETLFRWEKIREDLTHKIEIALGDYDGLFYTNGRILWRKNDAPVANEKISSSEKK